MKKKFCENIFILWKSADAREGKSEWKKFELTNWNSSPFPLQHTQQLTFSQLSNVVSLGREEEKFIK